MVDQNRFKHTILPLTAFTLAGVGALFWVLYFAGPLYPAEEGIREFESAFPVADAALIISLLLTGMGLFGRKGYGEFFLVVASAMALFLGLLDVTFYGNRGLYLPLTGFTAAVLTVNVLSMAGGLFGLWLGWRYWNDRSAGAR
ncbi:MAG: hypothetical protein JSV26_05320 [bacterium]|nr:MAG: hypothetical protein JSV26_05320 [bacterium]